MIFFVYVLKSPGFDRYYVGQTVDIKSRLARHNKGHEKSTSPYVPWELFWLGTKLTRAEAMDLERKLKNLSRVRLENFMLKYFEGRDAAEGLCRD